MNQNFIIFYKIYFVLSIILFIFVVMIVRKEFSRPNFNRYTILSLKYIRKSSYFFYADGTITVNNGYIRKVRYPYSNTHYIL